MAPVFEACLQLLFDQQRAETGTIDEEIAFDAHTRFEAYRENRAACRVSLRFDDPAFLPRDAAALRDFGQVSGVEPGIELESVIIGKQAAARLRRFEPPVPRRDDRQRVLAKGARLAFGVLGQPVMVERCRTDCLAICAEGVDVACARLAPIAEFDAQFDRRSRTRHHFALVDTGKTVEIADLGKGRLANAHGSDGIGLDERNRKVRFVERAGQSRCRHPSGGSPANDNDTLDPPFAHKVSALLANFRDDPCETQDRFAVCADDAADVDGPPACPRDFSACLDQLPVLG